MTTLSTLPWPRYCAMSLDGNWTPIAWRASLDAALKDGWATGSRTGVEILVSPEPGHVRSVAYLAPCEAV